MAEGGEIRAFMFCVVFITMFGLLLNTIPTDFQGVGDAGDTVIPIDPSLVTGFAASEEYCKSNFTGTSYEYTLNSRDWVAGGASSYLSLSAKKKVFGLWLGGLDICTFYAPDGSSNGITLEHTEIDADATDGAVRYTIQFDSGDAAGFFVVYWNITEYATATLAWAASDLWIIHGIGFDSSATTNIGALLVSLLLLQIPDVPILIGALLATPPWACIIFTLWFVIKETMPFV